MKRELGLYAALPDSLERSTLTDPARVSELKASEHHGSGMCLSFPSVWVSGQLSFSARAAFHWFQPRVELLKRPNMQSDPELCNAAWICGWLG